MRKARKLIYRYSFLDPLYKYLIRKGGVGDSVLTDMFILYRSARVNHAYVEHILHSVSRML